MRSVPRQVDDATHGAGRSTLPPRPLVDLPGERPHRRGHPLDSVYPVYTTYTIKPGDLKFVATSSKRVEQAKKNTCPILAAGIHRRALPQRPGFPVKLNKGTSMGEAQAGRHRARANVEPFKIEDLVESPSCR